jgi:hypothetical protein
MFGFIYDQPIYITLRQLCVVQITGIAISFYIMFDLLHFYKSNLLSLDSENVMTIFAFCGTVFATIWTSLNSIGKATYEYPSSTVNKQD